MRLGSLALILSLWTSAVTAEPAVTGQIEWSHRVAHGISGIEVDDHGQSFVAVTDRGWMIEGDFKRESGRLSGILLQVVTAIRGYDGVPVAARRITDWSDSEGLAIAPDGTMHIGFERWMRVHRYTAPDAVAEDFAALPGFLDYRDNRQIEALAVHPDGRLIAFPERPGRWRRFPVFEFDGVAWVKRNGPLESRGFSIVGADFTRDGTLYLLERKLFLGLWWQNQIRRIEDLDYEAAAVVWRGGLGEYYNLEGIGLFMKDGATHAILVGNNNGRSDRSEFVEIRLTD